MAAFGRCVRCLSISIPAGIPLAQTMAEGDIVHINTVFLDSLLAALAARLFGKKWSIMA